MKIDPVRWPDPWVEVVVFTILGSMLVGAATGSIHGRAGGLLIGAAIASIGALIWRADAIAWRDIASWTVPLAVWVAVAWVAAPSDTAYVLAGGFAVVWLTTFIFWLAPVRWWYRWILRKDVPGGPAPR
jgi:hypothetical protein